MKPRDPWEMLSRGEREELREWLESLDRANKLQDEYFGQSDRKAGRIQEKGNGVARKR